MPSSGPRYPGTVTTEVGPSGDNDWLNAGNISADDGSLAEITAATFDAGDDSFRLKAQNFGFTIPAGSTIDGITVEIERSNAAGAASDNEVRLYDSTGTLVGDNKAAAGDWPTALTLATYGSSSDTWAAGLDDVDVNDPDFGIAFIVNADGANTDIGVDFIRVTVQYTAPPAAIDAQPGSYSLSGVDATVPAGRVVSSDPGSYALTGIVASPIADRTVDAVPGAYALSGADAIVVAGRALAVDPGSYVLSGFLADLVFTSGGGAFEIDASPGSYALAGNDAAVVVGRIVSADLGSYVLSGAMASVVAARVLGADPGSYALVGPPASVVAGRSLFVDPGAYVVTGELAEFLRGLVLGADPGAYVFLGAEAGLIPPGGVIVIAGAVDRLLGGLSLSDALAAGVVLSDRGLGGLVVSDRLDSG